MSFNEKSLFWICVILTMGMAFTALMISLPRTVDMNNPTRLDYQGTIVAIFALLVTVLIGWQIYSSLDIDRRVYKAESRIANMLSQLQSAKKNISKTEQSSEDYTSGVNCLSVAMIEYIQTLYNKKAPLNERAKHYCTCYIVSARAIKYLLNSKKDEELLYPILSLCVEGIELSSDQLFSAKYLPHAKEAFSTEDHEICNEHYIHFMANTKSLGIDNLNAIAAAHSKRLELLKN